MTREDLTKRWDDYCSKYIPIRPKNFDASNYVFEAETCYVSDEWLRQMKADDKLKKLHFHQTSPDRGLGTFERSREQMLELAAFLERDSIRMAFGYELGKQDPIAVVADAASIASRDIWFVGDLHGDLLALRALRAFINSYSMRRPIFVFLGDLIDRNPFGLNVLIEVVMLLRDSPDSVFLIAGNHDDGLAWTGKRFTSSIIPHQFSDEMNVIADEATQRFVKAFISWTSKLPVGLVLPNGLFATHGGVPSRPSREVKNLWEGRDGQAIRRLIAEKRSEFLCNRFQKDVSTGSKLSPDFSWMEIVNFSEAMEKAYGVSIRFMVRGHDHCNLCRHDWAHSSFTGNDYCPPHKAERVRDVLTMTSMVMLYKEEGLPGFSKEKISYPTVAKYRELESRPEVFTVCLDSSPALRYCQDAQTQIKIEQARDLIKRKVSLLKNREGLCLQQERALREQDEKNNFLQALEKKLDEAKSSCESWRKRKEECENRFIPDNLRITNLRDKIGEFERELKKREDERAGIIKETWRQWTGRTDEDLKNNIIIWQKEIEEERILIRAQDAQIQEAQKNFQKADAALKEFCEKKKTALEERTQIDQNLKEVAFSLNQIDKALSDCEAAEKFLDQEVKE